ncbi:MAG: hypothetical protein IPK50_09785 [Fibrobacterota bacterium]|nr:MAG: hypothetical protein IPK50_09785 [Fibrobacterota bacterium]
MTRPIFQIVLLLSLCLGLFSCVTTNDPPGFHEVSLRGTFSAKDTALPFSGTISAPAGGIHLDFKVYEGSVDQTDRFLLRGAAPAGSITTWDLAADAHLRLINRSAATGTYKLLLIVVDGDGISDSLPIPFQVGATGIRYTDWVATTINLSLSATQTGIDLERGATVSTSDPLAKDATFFLTFSSSSNDFGTLYWLVLASPARFGPPLSSIPSARNDVRFSSTSKFDFASSPAGVLAYLDSDPSIDSRVDLTAGYFVLLKTGSGLVAKFKVSRSIANASSGALLLEGFVSRPY